MLGQSNDSPPHPPLPFLPCSLSPLCPTQNNTHSIQRYCNWFASVMAESYQSVITKCNSHQNTITAQTSLHNNIVHVSHVYWKESTPEVYMFHQCHPFYSSTSLWCESNSKNIIRGFGMKFIWCYICLKVMGTFISVHNCCAWAWLPSCCHLYQLWTHENMWSQITGKIRQ